MEVGERDVVNMVNKEGFHSPICSVLAALDVRYMDACCSVRELNLFLRSVEFGGQFI